MILRMQTVLVDLDTGDIAAKRAHLERHLGAPTMVVESGGVTAEGAAQVPRLVEAERARRGRRHRVVSAVCAATSPRRSAATCISARRTSRSGWRAARLLQEQPQDAGPHRRTERRPRASISASSSRRSPTCRPRRASSLSAEFSHPRQASPMDDVLVTPVREGGADDWTRFEGASAAIGHYIRIVHDGRIAPNDGWEAHLPVQRRDAEAACGRWSG